MVHGNYSESSDSDESESVKSESKIENRISSPISSNSIISSQALPNVSTSSKNVSIIHPLRTESTSQGHKFPTRKSYKSLEIEMPLIVPHTVPCVVLSPTHGQTPFNSSPLFPLSDVSPLDSIMTKISKLSNSVASGFRESGSAIWEQSERYHEDNLRESVELYDSMKQIVRDAEICIDEHASSKAPAIMVKRDSLKIEHHELSPSNSKALSFGIDRILANEKFDPEKSDGPRELSFLPILPKTHQDFSSRFLNRCSECYLLSRFCYKYTLPLRSPASALCPSTSNCTSWNNATPHLYDPNSPLLISNSTGYGHSSLAVYAQTNASNYNGIPSIVSCNTSNANGRRKRSWSRAVFSNLQRKGLEKRFQIQKYITKPDRRQLAATLGLTDAQVKVWFQNRRMKWRHTKEGKCGDGTGTALNSNAIGGSLNSSTTTLRNTSDKNSRQT